MKINKKKIYLFIYFFYILNCIFAETTLIYNVTIYFLLKVIRYILLFIFFAFCCNSKQILSRHFTIRSILLISLVMINSLFCGGGTGGLFIITIVLSSKMIGIKIDKLFKINIYVLSLGCFVIITLCILGILNDTIYTRYIGLETGRFFEGNYDRHTLGFLVSNQIPLMLLIIFILMVVYKKGKITLLESIVVFILNIAFFKYCGSRTAFVFTLLGIIFYLILKYLQNIKKLFVMKVPIFYLCFFVCCSISLYMAFAYDPELLKWRYINNLFMNRIIMGHKAIQYYGITLLGDGVSAGSSLGGLIANTVDNGYMVLFLQRGIILGAIVIFIWSKIALIAERKDNKYLLLSLLLLAGANLIDAHLLSYKLIPFYCLIVEKNSIIWDRNFTSRKVV